MLVLKALKHKPGCLDVLGKGSGSASPNGPRELVKSNHQRQPPARRSNEAVALEERAMLLGCELRPAVEMENAAGKRPAQWHCPLKCGDGMARVEAAADRVAGGPGRLGVKNDGDVDEAGGDGDVSQIGLRAAHDRRSIKSQRLPPKPPGTIIRTSWVPCPYTST